MDFANKVIIVVGGASGMGRETALRIAASGGEVLVADRDQGRATDVVEEIRAAGLRASFYPVDLAQPDSIGGFVREVRSSHAKIDALAMVAGWGKSQAFLENTRELWQQLVDINLMGPIGLTHGLLPLLIAAGKAKIVNVASDAGRVGSSGDTVYAAAKGGLIAFSKSLAREMARHRISVNCVCPGPTRTPLFEQQPARLRASLERVIPFGRLCEPREVAEAIAFLASESADFITGQVLSVSGGLTMAG
jgi:2-hydroxycyclohexanecarboxyl-CoA dehydrogenase